MFNLGSLLDQNGKRGLLYLPQEYRRFFRRESVEMRGLWQALLQEVRS
jgi:hypothetical protein